jgi:hypothetical protein
MRPRKVSRHCFPASDADPVRDFSPGDAGADVDFGPVGVKWRLVAIEDHQQFSLVGVDARQQTIQGGEADFGGEEGVEAPAQFPSPLRVRIFPIGLGQRKATRAARGFLPFSGAGVARRRPVCGSAVPRQEPVLRKCWEIPW